LHSDLAIVNSALTAQVGSTSHPLTNDDVAKLVQQHIDQAVIVKVVKSSANTFDTSPEALLKLKQAGAQQLVLDAMVVAKVSQQQGPGQAEANGLAARELPREITPGAPVVERAVRASRGKVCAATLAECTTDGCASSGSDHAAFNEAKRHMPAGNAHPVVLKIPDDFQTLQQLAEQKVGSGGDIPADSRVELANLQTSGGKVGEGSLVRVFGFLAMVPLETHPNTGESVNCGLKGEANNDLHIPLAGDPAGTDYEGIVVEMIPQDRENHPGWNKATLVKVTKQQHEVWVEGQLFYDNEHVVNDDQDNPIGGQPARMSLWEVHPITAFLVCPKTSGCSHTSKNEWVELGTFVTARVH
jgi:hypothetical protein